MAARSPMRPAHWIVLALVLAPAWKVVERLGRSGPKAVSAKSVAEGRILFNHDWTVNDPLTKGDGLGPVFNATSCLACHNQGGAGGGGPVARNVTVYGLSGGSTSKVPPRASCIRRQFARNSRKP